jgi:hypothetical protein
VRPLIAVAPPGFPPPPYADRPLEQVGKVARGHDYQCSALKMPADIPRGYRLAGRDGTPCGPERYLPGNVLDSCVLLSFAGHLQSAEQFAGSCRRWQDQPR